MKFGFNLFVSIALLGNIFSFQKTDKVFLGDWIYREKNEGIIVECNDVLRFGKNNIYYVLNDCYGSNIKLPVVEKGFWSYDYSRKTLSLTERKFYCNYRFCDSEKSLIFRVKEISRSNMRICLFTKLKCTEMKLEKK